MVRLSDVDESEFRYLSSLECPTYETEPFVTGPPLALRRLALISTAGLHLREDRPFGLGEAEYRVIPGSVKANDLIMSHISTNYDRTGFVQDQNVVFPLDRLKELTELAVIGSLADFHYSFMGATHPDRMEEAARNLAALLKADGVEAALLVPV